MGSSQSSAQLQPVQGPAVLMNTGAGVIVRIPDPVNGASTYEHNQRALTTPTAIISDTPDGLKAHEQTHVAVVRPGGQNQALKGTIVYLKKAPRSFMPPTPKP